MHEVINLVSSEEVDTHSSSHESGEEKKARVATGVDKIKILIADTFAEAASQENRSKEIRAEIVVLRARLVQLEKVIEHDNRILHSMISEFEAARRDCAPFEKEWAAVIHVPENYVYAPPVALQRLARNLMEGRQHCQVRKNAAEAKRKFVETVRADFDNTNQKIASLEIEATNLLRESKKTRKRGMEMVASFVAK